MAQPWSITPAGRTIYDAFVGRAQSRGRSVFMLAVNLLSLGTPSGVSLAPEGGAIPITRRSVLSILAVLPGSRPSARTSNGLLHALASSDAMMQQFRLFRLHPPHRSAGHT